MKAAVFLLQVLVAAALVVFSAVGSAANIPAAYQLMAENQHLGLYVDTATARFIIEDKETGLIWMSNPNDSNQQTQSQVSIVYYTPDGQRKEMNSFADSVKHGQYEIKPIENGVRIEYKMGIEWNEGIYLPGVISQARLKGVLSAITDESDRKLVEGYYRVVSLTESGDRIRFSVPNLDIESIFGHCAVLVHDQDYLDKLEQLRDLEFALEDSNGAEERQLVRDRIRSVESSLSKSQQEMGLHILNTVVNGNSDLSRLDQVTFEHVSQLVDNPTCYLWKVPGFVRNRLIEIMRTAGYTPQDAQRDAVENHLDPPQPNLEVFHIPVEYVLDEDSLVVRIPCDEIVYPVNVLVNTGLRQETVTYPLTTLSVLEYFGSAATIEQGYILVPDGSGALINLSGGKRSATTYLLPVYGRDKAIEQLEQLTISEQIYLPVYGIKRESQALFAIIEDGEALANISANTLASSKYGIVYATFTLIPRKQVNLGRSIGGTGLAEGRLNVYQSSMYSGDIKIRYAFLEGDNADYVGMARYFRNYLIANGVLQRLLPKSNIPFCVELIGGIAKHDPIIGIPRETILPLTTYSQVRDIVTRLLDSDAGNIRLIYTGWMRGGVRHVFPDRVYLEKSLGSKDDFLDLNRFLAENGIEFYPAVDFIHVYRNKMFDGFQAARDASRGLDRVVVTYSDFDRATYLRNEQDRDYLLSPSRLAHAVGKFMTDYETYDVAGIYLHRMGTEVNSDFRVRPEETVDRQQSKEIIEDLTHSIKADHGLKVMASGVNLPILKSVRGILDMPTGCSEFNVISEAVPFYQLVVHGFVECYGPPLNMDFRRKEILRLIESGVYPRFQWSYANTSIVKDTAFDSLYALCFEDWIDEAVQLYRVFDDIFADLQDKPIIGHTRLQPDVYMTTYENGVSVIVNYGTEPVTIMGVTVLGENYAVITNGECESSESQH